MPSCEACCQLPVAGCLCPLQPTVRLSSTSLPVQAFIKTCVGQVTLFPVYLSRWGLTAGREGAGEAASAAPGGGAAAVDWWRQGTFGLQSSSPTPGWLAVRSQRLLLLLQRSLCSVQRPGWASGHSTLALSTRARLPSWLSVLPAAY